MKTTSILVAGLLSISAAGAHAQTGPIHHQDTREVRADRQAFHHDDAAHEGRFARGERQAAWHGQRREDALVMRGDFRDARYLDQLRRRHLEGARIAARARW